MRKVLTLACLLAVAHHVVSQCNIPTYSENLIPQCAPNDTFIKWPNYENPASYYACNGVNNPVQFTCPANQYFCYVYQQCTSCAEYIPPVQCSQLRTQNTPNCVPIGQVNTPDGSIGSTYPTPLYPGSSSTTTTAATPTAAVPTAATPTAAPTTKSTRPTRSTAGTPEPTAQTGPTPPTEGPPTTGSTGITIPPPPSPFTNDPNVPMPPTPAPTPPSVPIAPPSIPSPPSASG